MIYGCCVNMLPKLSEEVGYEYAWEIKKAGYDYVELPLGQIHGQKETEFEEMVKELHCLQLPVHACNNFFTKEIKLVGECVDKKLVEEFYCKSLERASRLKSKYVVQGSPWSKKCPDGFEKERAFEQLVEWCIKIGDEASKYGITIALEPNNHQETNMICTFADTVKLAKAADHSYIKCLQDYFHLKMEKDTTESMKKYGKEYLVHTHFARFEGRGFPKDLSEDKEYEGYFQTLREIGYEGGISMEGFPVSRESFSEEAKQTYDFLVKATNKKK